MPTPPHPIKALGLVGSLGTIVAVCIAGGVWLGVWLGGWWIAVTTPLGIAAAILAAHNLIKRSL